MWPFKRKTDNAWVEADRRERRNTVLWVVGFATFIAGGVGLLIWALAGDHH